MDYDKQKEISFRHYPTLYLNESDFFDHMFFVIGNGYEWYQGQLCELNYPGYNRDTGEQGVAVPITEAELDERHIRHRKEVEELKAELREHRYQLMKDPKAFDVTPPQLTEREQEIAYRNNCIDRFGDTDVRCWFKVEGYPDDVFGKKCYPISHHSHIMNLPDDIKADWLNAAARAIEWAYSPLCRTTESDREHLARAKERVAELRKAQLNRCIAILKS